MQIVTIRKKTLIRNISFILILAVSFGVVIAVKDIKTPTEEIKIYFVDYEMMRLIPIKTKIPKIGTQKMAQYVLDALIEGHDDNKKIRRMLPKEKNCLSVKIKDKIAYVDISESAVSKIPGGRDCETLTIYSIVNTLTGIDGIVNVRFTIGGKIKKDLNGFTDMRETFIPDYTV